MASFSITVNTLMGVNFSIDVTSHDTVEMLKYRISFQEDLRPQQQHIVLGVRELGNEEMLSQVGLKEGSTVKLVLGLRGGPLGMRRVAQPKPTEDNMSGGLLVTRDGMFFVKFNDLEDPDYSGPEICIVLPFKDEDVDISQAESLIRNPIERDYKDYNFLPPISQTAFQETDNRIKAEVLLSANNYSYSGQLPYSYVQLAKYVRAKLYLMKDEEKQYKDRRSNVVLYSSDDESSTPPNFSLEPFTFQSAERKNAHSKESSNEKLRPRNLKSRNGRKSGVSERKSSRPETSTGGKKRIRCAECKKKLPLATQFPCRCGKLFCYLHRYAETHICTYDYKEEGRRVMRDAITKFPFIHRVTRF